MKKIILLINSLIAIAFTQTICAQQWLTAENNLVGGELLGSLNSQPLNIVTNNTSRIYVTPTGRIGIGTQAPISLLTVKGAAASTPAASWVPGSAGIASFNEGVNVEQILATAANSGARPVFFGMKARGTLAAPAVVNNNDYLFSFLASGYDGTAFQNSAAVDFFADAAPSANNLPARIS